MSRVGLEPTTYSKIRKTDFQLVEIQGALHVLNGSSLSDGATMTRH